MKKLLLLILFISITFLGYSQYNITQNLGGPTTLVQNPNYGGFRGGLIPYTFSDTTSANSLASLLKLYNGALIYCTADNAVYWRDATNQKWVQLLPSGGTGGLSAWLTTGNFAVPTDVNGYAKFGTFGTNGINVITSGNTVFKIHADGIVPDTGTVQGLGVNSYGELSYFSGGGGATPTWQQTLTAGSTLNQTNTVLLSGDTMIWKNGKFWITASDFTNPYLIIDPTPGGDRYGLGDLNGNLSVNATSIYVDNQPGDIDIHSVGDFSINGQGNYYFTGLKTGLTPPTQIGTIKYVTTDQNGHFSFSDILTVPTWQETLDAGSSLNTNNTISMNGNSFIWSGNSFSSYEGTVGVWSFETLSGPFSFAPYTGQFIIDTLNNETFQNTLMGWTSTSGANRGKVGYITIGSGLSLSSGVLSSTVTGLAIGNTVTSATAGSIFFAGTGGTLQQKNSTLFFDSTNIELGLGTNSPASLFNAIAGVCDFRFSKGLSDVTPAMTVINTSGMAGGLLAGTSGAAFVYDNAGPFYLISENHSAFVNNQLGGGAVRMTLTATGELGINTTSPGEKLEVSGNAKVSGKFIGRNIIYRTLNASDADFTAAVGTAYVLPDNTADRTITLPTPQDADIIRFQVTGSSFHWDLSTSVTLPDNTTTVSRLDTYVGKWVTLYYDGANSKWKILEQ